MQTDSNNRPYLFEMTQPVCLLTRLPSYCECSQTISWHRFMRCLSLSLSPHHTSVSLLRSRRRRQHRHKLIDKSNSYWLWGGQSNRRRWGISFRKVIDHLTERNSIAIWQAQHIHCRMPDSLNSFAQRNCLHCLHITGPSNIWCVSHLRSIHCAHTHTHRLHNVQWCLAHSAVLTFVLCPFYRFVYVLRCVFLLSSSRCPSRSRPSRCDSRQVRSCFSKTISFLFESRFAHRSKWILSSISMCIRCSLSHAPTQRNFVWAAQWCCCI